MFHQHCNNHSEIQSVSIIHVSWYQSKVDTLAIPQSSASPSSTSLYVCFKINPILSLCIRIHQTSTNHLLATSSCRQPLDDHIRPPASPSKLPTNISELPTPLTDFDYSDLKLSSLPVHFPTIPSDSPTSSYHVRHSLDLWIFRQPSIQLWVVFLTSDLQDQVIHDTVQPLFWYFWLFLYTYSCSDIWFGLC